MEKINIQVNNLKLNVTNIKSSLISSNKKLKKLRSDKISLFSKEKDREEKLKKEKSIESPMEGLGKFGRTIGGIARNIAKGPLSFFDTIKEFFGLLLTGIIINNLPYIVDQIKGFFDRNKWLVEGTKFILSVIGKGIMGIINLVDKFTPSQQDKINGDAKKLKEEFSRLDRNLGDDNAEIDKRLSELEKEQKEDEKNKNQKEYKKQIETRQESRSSTPSPGSIDPQSTNPAPQPRRTPEKPPEVQKFAKGGMVQPRKSVDTGTKPQATKTMTAGSSSLGTTKASVRSKKAVQTVNYFSFFNNNNAVSQEIVEKDSKNIDAFRDILVSLKSIQEIRKQLGDDEGGGPGGGGPGGGGPGGGMLPGDAPPEMKAAMEAIAGAEGGWNSVNPGKVVPGLTNMTIAEAREVGMRQRSVKGSGALGKFQQMPVINGVNTLKQRAEAAGLNYQTDKFNEENQTKITRAYLAGIYPGGEAQLIQDARKDPMILANKLKGVYPSLPGGSQPNVHTSGYLDRFRNAYAKYKAPSATPTQGSLAAVLPQGRPQFTSGFRSSNRPDHEGIDIGVDANSPVAALQDGVVETIYRDFGDWGDAVVVKHSDGTKWIYGHVISSVKKGDSVKRGQIIAKVKYWPYGAAGNYTYQNNTHLHLERLVGGKKVNPTSYLNNQRNLAQLSSNPQSRNLSSTSSTPGKTLVAVLPVVNNNNKVIPYPIPIV